MRRHIGIFGLLLASLLGCAMAGQDGSETQRASAQTYQTVCSVLGSSSAHVKDSSVTVKGYLVVHAHGAALRDAKCGDKAIFLRYQDGGPYFQFCESDRLSREFGCPAGKNGPIVTVSGMLSRRDSSKNGALTVEKILEYTSTRTGERVDP
jgi:hypothetical protein